MKYLLLLTLCTLLQYADAACYSGSSPIQCSDSDCGGSCTSDNGCVCYDNNRDCVPVSSQCPDADNSCCNMLSDWYWDGALQCCTETPSCSPSCYSDEICNITDTDTMCICNDTAYKSSNPKSLVPTVTCDDGTMITSISLCQLKQVGYDYTTFHLLNDSNACTYTYNNSVNNVRVRSIQLKAAIGWCGNVVESNSSKISFTNTLYINPFPGPLITKNPIVYNFTCVYNLTMQTSLNFYLNPVLSSVVIPSPEAETGSFTIVMAAYSDAAFSVPIQQDKDILVGSNIYLGLFSADLDGDVFALRVEKCFATPSPDPNDYNNVQFVSGGCAINGDIQSVVILNGNSTEARIQTSAFLFQGFTEVHIFCDVNLCNKTNGCEGCNIGRSAGKADFSQLGISLNLKASDYFSSSGHHTAASWIMLAASLLVLLPVKFF